ncbi:MAG: BREX system P-loop protein BrxC, partial [Bacteroidales bacterium]|nr:BREX system P-loop protein BrxC [Bacteroidales bacterium]
MKFKDLYEKSLDRKVNPAVSASDLNEETVKTEIDEYVFTPEIVANLYKILSNVRQNEGDHVGIWINGYYGSGKSHFLKYTSYCLSSKYAEHAFNRLIEAAQEILLKEDSELEQAGVSLSELKALKNWYVTKAKVEMVLFNIGDVHDVNANQKTAFTSIFWNQFNARRGYNSVNLALAQYLEKALDDDGKFVDFKNLVAQKGYDWEANISRFAAGRLDLALDIAGEVDPDLAFDVIRQRVINNEINVSVDNFANELKEYIDRKNDRDHRIMFFVDEVSQFISEHPDLLLQLQSLVEKLEQVCESKVWIACTAQQSLEEVVQKAGGNISNPNDAIGKILGRFEVRASLQGTKPEYITQRRILEKNGQAEIELKKLFNSDKAKLDAQFVLPTTYRSYNDEEDFAAYYPFVPYQFQLIMKVLDSFVNMNYVDKQVKGNERSLINITFSIARETADCEVGEFIPFDRFFGAMFQGSMQHFGQRAIENARQAVQAIADRQKQQFYSRVVNVLFMVCNLSDVDKQTFSATIDNVVTLLMTKIDANKAVIKDEVNEVLSYLMDKSVIRKIKTDSGTEIYDFYTQEESQVAELIKNQSVDSNTYSDELHKIISDYLNMSNRETYATRSFTVGVNVDGRSYLYNNADIVVDFLTTSSSDTPDQYSLVNTDNHLVYFLCPQWNEQKELRNSFIEYCRVQRFAMEPAVSEARQKTKRMFQERAKEMYDKEIVPKFRIMLDTCPVISGQSVLTSTETGTSKGKDRYRSLVAFHLG